MLGKLVQAGKSFFGSVKKVANEVKDKALALIGVGASTIAAVQSQAAITFNSTTGEVEGSLDLAGYYSGVEMAMGVLGTTIVVGLIFTVIRRFVK